MTKLVQCLFLLLIAAPFSQSFSVSVFNRNVKVGILETAIFAGTDKGLGISYNEGITWPVTELTNMNIYSIVSNGNGTLYLSNDYGLLKSTGDDQQWDNLTEGIGKRNVRSYYITSDEQEIYIGSEYNYGNLRYTHDGGKVWGEKTIGKKSSVIIGLGEIDGTIFALASDVGLYSSTDRGDIWRLVAMPHAPQYSNVLSFCISNGRIYVGTDNSLLISDDQGKTWQSYTSKNGLPGDTISAIFVKQWPNAKNETIYVGTALGIGISDNYGQTWKALDVLSVISVYVTDDNTVYAGTSSYGLTYSSDGIIWFTASKDDGLPDNYVKGIYAEPRTISD